MKGMSAISTVSYTALESFEGYYPEGFLNFAGFVCRLGDCFYDQREWFFCLGGGRLEVGGLVGGTLGLVLPLILKNFVLC